VFDRQTRLAKRRYAGFQAVKKALPFIGLVHHHCCIVSKKNSCEDTCTLYSDLVQNFRGTLTSITTKQQHSAQH